MRFVATRTVLAAIAEVAVGVAAGLTAANARAATTGSAVGPAVSTGSSRTLRWRLSLPTLTNSTC
jgi:hypothetical protein